MEEPIGIKQIVTFGCQPNIHVYYEGCVEIPRQPYQGHKDLNAARFFMANCKRIYNPTIVEYKHPDKKERLIKMTLPQARELAEVAANNMGAPFASLAKILLSNFTLDELRPQEVEMKEFKGYEQLKQEDFMVDEKGVVANPRKKDHYIIPLETAQLLWKKLPHGQPTGWSSSERFVEEYLLKNFTKEELEGEPGFTWEESFSKRGFETIQGIVIPWGREGDVNKKDKCVFKTREQAKSALAFAQLSHIVAQYNENKLTNKCRYYSIGLTDSGKVMVFTSDQNYMGLGFVQENDAKISMKINEELWKQYWMIK